MPRVLHKSLMMLLVAVAVTYLCWLPANAQDEKAERSYRLTPPLRLAARPVDGTATREVTQADPFRPRDPRKQPAALAVQGYCLVTLRDQQQWVQGSPRIQVILGGKVYLFASSRARDIFTAAPELYLPMLDGDCPVTFIDTGERVSGELEHGLVFGRRVYFFTDQAKMQAFQAAPGEYVGADLVEGGQCIVSKAVDNRLVPGIPETVVIVDGRRYFFASAHHRRLFLQNPEPLIVHPLRNPQALLGMEIPSVAEAARISSLDYGKHEAPATTGDTSPLKLIKRQPNKKKGGKSGAAEDDDSLAESIPNRALAGYCPVTIRTQNTWRRGKPKFKFTFDGKIYYLSGPEEQSVFQENPRNYAPVLSGDSVVALANEFERVPGSVFHALIYNERLYLFANAEERKAFRDDPALYENADLAAQGNCMVSRIDEQREVEGLAEFETLYLGKRYRFASEESLQKFLADPKTYADD